MSQSAVHGRAGARKDSAAPAAPTSVRAAAQDGTSRLEQIRQRALQLFAERGFDRVGMRELALHLGMAAGSFYHHFQSKEQLLFEAIDELYEDLLEAAAASEAARGDRLRALLQAHVALHEPRRLHFLLAEQAFRCLEPHHQERILQLRQRYEAILLQRLRAAGAQAAEPLLRIGVRGLVAWLNGLSAWLVVDEQAPAQRRQLLDGVVRAALAGVLAPAAAPAPPARQALRLISPGDDGRSPLARVNQHG